jgi:hypothetical protein
MKLSEMKANPDNPRRISQKQLEMLQKSLDQFGELNCLVFNETSGQVVSGHQRLKTLPPGSNVVWERVFDQPTKTGTTKEGFVDVNGERFKIRAVAWDAVTEKTAIIAANQHGGEFDYQILTDWINELDSQNIDLDLLGFSDAELENLMDPFSDKLGAKELSSADFETFNHVCPRCGFEFDSSAKEKEEDVD